MNVKLAVQALAAATAVLLTASAPAVASPPALLDLGPGQVLVVSERGDFLGDQGGLVLWRHGEYAPIEIGVGATWGPVGINRHADVVGHRGDGPGFLWRDGTLTSLVHPTGDAIWGAAINDRGQIAGFRVTDARVPDRPLLWRNGVFTDFGSWHGLTAGEAVDINNRGQAIVNLYAADGSTTHAVLWWHGVVTDLGNLGMRQTRAVAINERGMVIGWGTDRAGHSHPFLWRNGRMTNLTPGTARSGEVVAINNAGDAVGQVDGTPVLWRRGVRVDLRPGRSGIATAINDRGYIAGTTYDPNSGTIVRTPFRWRRGHVREFPILYPGLSGTWVSGVDNHGRVIGRSLAGGGLNHVVVWGP